MERTDMRKFLNKNYVTGNMVLSVVGGVERDIKPIEKYFSSLNEGKGGNELGIGLKNKRRIVPESRKINQSYMILGYRTVPRAHKDSLTLDVIHAVLGRGESGWMFDEIRNKRGLAYNVRVEHEPELDYGVFAVSVGTKKKNVKKVVGIIEKTLERIQKLTPTELSSAKEYIEGSRLLELEDNTHRADHLCFHEHVGDCMKADEYIKRMRAVTLADVKKTAEKYFTDEYTLTEIRGE
jgi:predicted Zn-dependent peptidase